MPGRMAHVGAHQAHLHVDELLVVKGRHGQDLALAGQLLDVRKAARPGGCKYKDMSFVA